MLLPNYSISFKQEFVSAEINDDEVTLQVKVTNTGNFKCKDVVEVYVNAPQGKLGKAEKVLAGFNKTKERTALSERATEVVETLAKNGSDVFEVYEIKINT